MDLEAVGGERLGKIEGDIDARDVDQRAFLRVEAPPHQLGQGRTVAGRRDDGGEAQALGGGGRRVADGDDRLGALIARFGERARTVGAGQQHGLAGGQGLGEVGGGRRISSRNSGAMTGA